MNAGSLKQAMQEVELALEGNDKASAAFETLKGVVDEYMDILETSAQEKADVLMECLSEEDAEKLVGLLASGDTKAFTREVEKFEEKHGEEMANSERMDELINQIGIQLAWNGDAAEHLASTMSPSREPGL